MAKTQVEEETLAPGLFCSEDGVCRASNISTVTVLAQGIEMVLNNLDFAVYLVATILL